MTREPHSKITAFYVRYSPRPVKLKAGQGNSEFDSVDEPTSIETQIKANRNYVSFSLPQAPPIRIFQDPAVSAGMPIEERPAGGDLLRAVRAGLVQHVVTQRIDRIFRDVVDGRVTIAELEKRGAELHLSSQGGATLRSSTPQGLYMITMLLANAELERGMIVERTSYSMLHQQANGVRMTPLDKCPIGTMPCPDDPTRLVENSHERLAIEEAVRLQQLFGWSFRKIARKLAELGYKPRGNAWQHNTVKGMIARYWDEESKKQRTCVADSGA